DCSVSRLRMMCLIVVGTIAYIRLQFVRLAAPSSGRSFELHREDRSPNVPSVRTTPPSEPLKICVGFDGLTMIACWSGWIPAGAHRHAYGALTPPKAASPAAPREHHVADGSFCVSNVRSVNVRFRAAPVAAASGSPAVVEYKTARPFERPLPQPTPLVLHGNSP